MLRVISNGVTFGFKQNNIASCLICSSSDIKNEDLPWEYRLLNTVFLSDAQKSVGRQPFLTRRSDIYKGLSFVYQIEAVDEGTREAGHSAEEIAEKIISDRDFGKGGGETLRIIYCSSASDIDFRDKQNTALRNVFYEIASNDIAQFEVLGDSRISLSWSEKHNYPDHIKIVRTLEDMEGTWVWDHGVSPIKPQTTKYFDQENSDKLMGYTRELKEAA